MREQTGTRQALTHGHGESIEHDVGAQVALHRPADDAAREEVDDDGEEQPALSGPDVRDVPGPNLVARSDGKIAVEYVWYHRRRRHVTRPMSPTPSRLVRQTALAQQSRDALSARALPAFAQLSEHTRTAVGTAACSMRSKDKRGAINRSSQHHTARQLDEGHGAA